MFRPQSICTDADVQAFMAATGITDPTIDRAICNLVAQLKADNLWNKLDAIYPMVGEIGRASCRERVYVLV